MSEIQVGQINSTDGSTAITTGADGYVSFAKTQIGGRRNLIINGAMQVAQRGTSTSTHGGFPVDRFKSFGNATTLAFTATQDSDAPDNFINSLKYTVGTAATAADGTDRIEYNVEGHDIAHLNFGSSAAQTLTLSFYVKSSLTGTYAVAFQNQATDRHYIEEFTISTADTWERKTITITGDASGTWLTNNSVGLRLRFPLNNNSSFRGTADSWQAGNDFTTANVINFTQTLNATFQITGVQLEVGTVATPFEHRSYGEELALCQRYYYQEQEDGFSRIGVVPGTTTSREAPFKFPVVMRANPSVTVSGGAYYHFSSTSNETPSSTVASGIHQRGFYQASSGLSSRTRGDTLALDNWLIKADAEL